MRKSILGIIVLSIFCILLTGVEAADNSYIYLAYQTEPYIDLDPSVEYSNGIIVLPNVYETLTRYNNETEKVEPLLATEWTTTEDGLTWEFTLRDNVTFHDGSKLTGEAVKKSIERTKTMGMGASYNWDPVQSIEAPADNKVVFHLSHAAPIDLIASSGYAAYIISPKVIDKVGTDSSWFNEGHDGGCGPYMIKKVTPGEEVVLVAYDKYYGGWSNDQYKNVLIKKVTESSTRRQLVESGEAQITGDLSVTDMTGIKDNPDVTTFEQSSWKNVIGFFNTQVAPLNNADFRRAMAYAFPYDETVKSIKEGHAVQSHGLIPAGLWGHDDSLFQYSLDMDKAKEYLAKSGVDTSKGITLEMTFTSGIEAFRSFAQIYKANLAQLGINLEINEMNWDSVWEKSKSTNPEDRQDILVMYWWPDYANPISWFDSLIHSEDQVSFNLAYIKDPEIDTEIEQADELVATDRDKASKTLIDVQKKVIDQAYLIHIFDENTINEVYKTIGNFKMNPAYETVTFFYDLRKAK